MILWNCIRLPNKIEKGYPTKDTKDIQQKELQGIITIYLIPILKKLFL